jgi:hypothetical protein
MATGTPGSTARRIHQQVPMYLKQVINAADITATTLVRTLSLGVLPAGAVIDNARSGVYVHTVFNGGATNTLDVGKDLTVGSAADPVKFGSALALGTVAFVVLDDITVTTAGLTEDTPITARTTFASVPTTGKATILILYY